MHILYLRISASFGFKYYKSKAQMQRVQIFEVFLWNWNCEYFFRCWILFYPILCTLSFRHHNMHTWLCNIYVTNRIRALLIRHLSLIIIHIFIFLYCTKYSSLAFFSGIMIKPGYVCCFRGYYFSFVLLFRN